MSRAGNGSLSDGSYGDWNSTAGGGAGIPSGKGVQSKNANTAENGKTGCGGLLVIYTKALVLNGGSHLSAIGQDGGYAKCGGSGAGSSGGGSGGGSINVFTEEVELSNNTNISSFIKISGGNGGNGAYDDNPSSPYTARGGAGGTGSCNIGIITTGTYEPYYSNN